MSREINEVELSEMADRFRAWSRTEEGATVCRGVAEGSFKWENELVGAFIDAVAPEPTLQEQDRQAANLG